VAIDLNADLGEGYGVWRLGDDEALLGIVTSANVACGFHAGDPLIMRKVCEQAVLRGVVIGAQVGYPDLRGFGRRRIDVEPDELCADVLYQIGALDACARAAGAEVRYVKPHGALYNTAAVDRATADAIVTAVASFGVLPVLGLPGSTLAVAAHERRLPFISEGFADRAYRPDGRLVPRRDRGALLTDPEEVVARSIRLAREGQVEAIDGSVICVDVRSLCLHGDTLGAVVLARGVRDALIKAGIAVEPFA
jgi:5-oxoprolinase (ATP-hydrolysing) subunit A